MKTFFQLIIVFAALGAQSQNTVNAQAAVADSSFVNIRDFSHDFVYDMRYATANNFLNAKVYDCGECYLRYATVKALLAANEIAKSKGLTIALFDCYRPVEIQQKMWKIVSDPKYVADPAKGSIHNRGGAVDITLVNTDGSFVDMGTDFDHFGKEAAHSYQNLTVAQKHNRKILSEIMAASGFAPFESEWWHYNLLGSAKFPVSNFKWKCCY